MKKSVRSWGPPLLVTLFGLFLLLTIECVERLTAGGLGNVCYGNHTCDKSLECVSSTRLGQGHDRCLLRPDGGTHD